MKPWQVLLPFVAVLVAAVIGALGFLLWRRYEEDRAVLLDEADLDVTLLQRAMLLRFVNHADEDELAASGIRARQRQLILEHRPFQSLTVLAETTGIGRGTLRSAFNAAIN